MSLYTRLGRENIMLRHSTLLQSNAVRPRRSLSLADGETERRVNQTCKHSVKKYFLIYWDDEFVKNVDLVLMLLQLLPISKIVINLIQRKVKVRIWLTLNQTIVVQGHSVASLCKSDYCGFYSHYVYELFYLLDKAWRLFRHSTCQCLEN